ncbi:hypothetical protein [Micromonospora purpureochromogenes]|uniref:Uncharacterized protein n=1 Tax=Micromonospora purpureochromogenes TaxID=47872 RepID=A0ABX2RI83_9ACTN|nr:hypothetical protein [Micromonospora purpureochromogenes]NYF56212.1 hypothetical protein [Micromonospora purpureochromogenes]
MTQDAGAPARPPRPTAVTVASWMQIAAAVVLLALLGLVLWQAIEWNGEIDRAARLVPDADPDEVSGERVGNIVMSSVLGVPALLFAAGLLATARGVRRGSNVARILVFVAGGLQLLAACAQGGLSLLFIPFLFALGGPEEDWDSDIPAEFMPEESGFMRELYGDGSDPTGDVLFGAGSLGTLLVVGLTLTAVVLLALPLVHRWFVPRAAEQARRAPLDPTYPPAFLLPPGYMLCPDPRAHGLPPQPMPAAPQPMPAAPAQPATQPMPPQPMPDAPTQPAPATPPQAAPDASQAPQGPQAPDAGPPPGS